MTDISPPYRRLIKQLKNTRKTLVQGCRDADVDLEYIDDTQLDKVIKQCTHCDIWGTQHAPDLDDNPICGVCLRLVGA